MIPKLRQSQNILDDRFAPETLLLLEIHAVYLYCTVASLSHTPCCCNESHRTLPPGLKLDHPCSWARRDFPCNLTIKGKRDNKVCVLRTMAREGPKIIFQRRGYLLSVAWKSMLLIFVRSHTTRQVTSYTQQQGIRDIGKAIFESDANNIFAKKSSARG